VRAVGVAADGRGGGGVSEGFGCGADRGDSVLGRGEDAGVMGINRRGFLAGSMAFAGLLVAGFSIPQMKSGSAESLFWRAFYANARDTTLVDIGKKQITRISKSGARRVMPFRRASMSFGEERYGGLYRGSEMQRDYYEELCGKQCAEFISHNGAWSPPKFVSYRDWTVLSAGQDIVYGWYSMSIERLRVK